MEPSLLQRHDVGVALEQSAGGMIGVYVESDRRSSTSQPQATIKCMTLRGKAGILHSSIVPCLHCMLSMAALIAWRHTALQHAETQCAEGNIMELLLPRSFLTSPSHDLLNFLVFGHFLIHTARSAYYGSRNGLHNMAISRSVDAMYTLTVNLGCFQQRSTMQQLTQPCECQWCNGVSAKLLSETPVWSAGQRIWHDSPSIHHDDCHRGQEFVVAVDHDVGEPKRRELLL